MPTLTTKFYETRTDTELCKIALHGHIQEAFGVIYDRYRDRIYGLACSYAEDRDDAEDVTQQVFIRAHRSLHQFRGGSQLFTWLYRIAINCCKDWVQQAYHARKDRCDDYWWSKQATGDDLFSKPTRTESRLEQREADDFLQKALARLTPEFRSALVLRELDGMSYREIGRALGCSEGTVKSRICRARHQLKKQLVVLGYTP